MTTSEPTTGEIVRALRCIADNAECKDCRYKYPVGNVILCDHEQMNENAADRLESQEQKLELLNGGDFDVIDIPAALAYLESVEEILPHASALIDLIQSLKGTAIELTARAEQAEKERDAAVAVIGIQAEKLKESHVVLCNICEFEDMIGCVHKNHCDGYQLFRWRGQPQEGEGL